MSTKTAPMHIIEFHGNNFKRLRAFRYTPKPRGVTEIAGRNAQGKSSLIDLIWAILGGKKASPARPVREGATRAEGFIDLGPLKIMRKWTQDGGTTLYVESADGTPIKSPQDVLDKLVGVLGFDALKFTRQEPKDQARTLKELVGLDFSTIDQARQEAYDRRTLVNREAAKLEGQLSALPIVNAPDQEVVLAELLKKHTAAVDTRAANDAHRTEAHALSERADSARELVADLKIQLKQAETALESLERRVEAAEEKVFGLRDPDLDAIALELKQVEATNAAVRKKRERRAVEEAIKAKGEERAKLELVISDCDEKKRTTLAAAKFPIVGLSVEGETVTFNGQPITQASTAEKIRVSLAIGAALNPTLRVMLVWDGSSLDSDSLTEVERWAEENDMQVFLERVGDATTATGIVIEDGEIKETI